jgi:hypothetical protein
MSTTHYSYGEPLITSPQGVSSVPKNSRKSARGIRRRATEGPRGASVRAAVWLRYAGYLGLIIICSGITQVCFSKINDAHSGGEWMFLSACFQLCVAAVGSWAFANRRPEIIHQMRSYVFGYTVLPGTGIALFMWAASHIAVGPSGTDVFVNSLNTALPWLYFLPIILPCVIFTKAVAGMRTINRETMDDQEIMTTYTRNDEMQR